MKNLVLFLWAAIITVVLITAHAAADERRAYSGEIDYLEGGKLRVAVLESNSRVQKVLADADIDYDAIVAFLTFSSEELPSYEVMPTILNFRVIDDSGIEYFSLGSMGSDASLDERLALMDHFKELEDKLKGVSNHWSFFLTDSRRIEVGRESGFVVFMSSGLPPLERWRRVFVKDSILNQDIELFLDKYVFSSMD